MTVIRPRVSPDPGPQAATAAAAGITAVPTHAPGMTTTIPEKIIKPWKLPPQKKYVLRNARVIDPVAGAVLPRPATVRLAGGKIESVDVDKDGDADDPGADDADAVVVDLAGRLVCPGLIDCHVHLSAVAGSATLDGVMALRGDDAASLLRQPDACARTLRRGFTTVRDCGGAPLPALRDAIDDDVFPGPRLFAAGRALSQTGGHGDTGRGGQGAGSCCGGGGGPSGLSVICDGVPECIRAAREQLRSGADFIKLMVGGGVASPTDRLENTQFTGAEVRAIAEVARSYGTWVTAHAYTPAAIRHAVENGVTGIEHGNFIDEDTARYMAERDVWLTPTLVTYQALGSDKYAGFLPPANQDKNQRVEVLAQGLRSLEIAAAAGVKMCYGSDLLGPMTAEQPREFGLRARVLASPEVLRHATVNAARMLRREHVLGQVRAGFAADLLVLAGDANPLDDVAVLDRPEESVLAVVKDGRVYESRWSGLPRDV
ncbi:amidohydrolase [Xylariaceae sp. FL0804]|nr:amidohydrolase [Xylariaceae sp. FL0804]